jgi:hypothetical protein
MFAGASLLNPSQASTLQVFHSSETVRPVQYHREAMRGCMGRLRFGQWVWVLVSICLFVWLPACGGSKPRGVSTSPAKVNLNPATSYSLQLGSVIAFTATAQNSSNSNVAATFTYASSNPGIVDVAPNGLACAGTWNAPSYNVCTPAGLGVVQVTATAQGATSPPTLVFVHPFIASVKISIVPPVNSPPPACPAQIALPVACNLPFKAAPNNACLSQNQIQTLQATAYDSQGNDITSSVGPFAWTQATPGVASIVPIITTNAYNVPTNQATASPGTPGQTQVIASASGVSSQSFDFETCPVQCIALELGVSGSQRSTETSFTVTKGTTETVTATAVDVQGCIVPKAPLTWTSSEPAALSAGAGSSACGAGTTTCTISTTQPGVAAITASCTPPTCNVGFPLNLPGAPAPYAPQPVYPVTAISGLVTGTPSSTSVLATSQDCYSNQLCDVGIYNVSTSTNLQGAPALMPAPPNSLIFDAAGDKAFMGSQFGAATINPASIGTANPFASLPAPGTTLGLVIGKVLAVSRTGNVAVFSDTVSTPNQVYVVTLSPPSTLALNINSATAAAFSPDGLKAFILGNGGNSLYIYSTLQPLLPPIQLPAPATSIVFSSSGSFALLSGGTSPATNFAIYNICDNSAVTLASPAAALPSPPLFLTMVPSGNVPMGNPTIPLVLETQGLDFFYGIDNTGIDIIATNSSQGPYTTLCPQQVTLAHTLQNQPFAPTHINIGQGTFHPINFFLSPDSTQAYIIASDLGVLVYNFDTDTTSGIPLVNNATPIAASMSVDGTLIYVAASDGLLHEVNTQLALDRMDVYFSPLANSSNSFCSTGTDCTLNLVAVKP